RVVSALDYQQRSLDFCSRSQRRLSQQLCLSFRRVWIAHAFVEKLANLFPVWRNRFQQRDQIRWSNNRDSDRVNIRRKRNPSERRITSIRTTHDADLLGIGNALRNEILHAPGYVVLHLVAPLLVSG